MTDKTAAKLNIIGCGKTGSVLARLWNQTDALRIAGVLTQSQKSARGAVAKIGTGNPLGTFDEMQPADIFMIAVPDQLIGNVASRLSQSGICQPGNTVFHLSGALESRLLRDAGLIDVSVASIHPLRSFADFEKSVAHFAGTWCGFEGDVGANPLLSNAFEKIGGKIFMIKADKKLVYHAASVMVSNYANALIEAGHNCYQLAGIDRQTSQKLIEPIFRSCCEDIINNGPLEALTGPIARGEADIVARELEKLTALNSDLAEIYKTMGKATLVLAESGNLLNEKQIKGIKQALK